jgi:hypothetical protein
MTLRRSATVLIACLMCAFGACSDADVTPLLDAARIALVTRGDQAYVTGSSGAVWPAGSTLSATNLRSRDEAHGVAAQDGSFDLAVDGTNADVFELIARSGKLESAALFVSAVPAVSGHDDRGELSCSERAALTTRLIERAAARADRTCASDGDCVRLYDVPTCFRGCIDHGFSRLGAAQVNATLESIGAGLCGPELASSCNFDLAPCPEGFADAAPCLNGTCAFRAIDGAGGDRCQGAQGEPGTQGVLTVNFETQPLYTDPHWGPSNLGAVWIEDASGTYIKTIERWASHYARALYHWQTHACTRAWPEPDAVSQATLDAPAKHSSTWDSKDLHGNVVPDGTYYLLIEVSETETAYGPLVAYAFEKGDEPISDRMLSGSEIQVRPLLGVDFIPPLDVTISYTPSPDAGAP